MAENEMKPCPQFNDTNTSVKVEEEMMTENQTEPHSQFDGVNLTLKLKEMMTQIQAESRSQLENVTFKQEEEIMVENQSEPRWQYIGNIAEEEMMAEKQAFPHSQFENAENSSVTWTPSQMTPSQEPCHADTGGPVLEVNPDQSIPCFGTESQIQNSMVKIEPVILGINSVGHNEYETSLDERSNGVENGEDGSTEHCTESDVEIKKGASFNTYQDLRDAITRHEKKHHVLFIKREGRKVLCPNLINTVVYSFVVFECKHEPDRKTTSAGASGVRTVKLDCSARIKATLREAKGKFALVITEVNLTHDTHSPSQEVFEASPEKRKMILTDKVWDSLSNKELREEVLKEKGTHPFMTDIQNLRAKFSKMEPDFSEVQTILEDICADGGRTELITSESSGFVSLSFQTEVMKSLLSRYPEFLVMDVIYNTNSHRFPLLTVMCIDADGIGQPIFHSFLSSEERGVIVKALDFLKSCFDFTRTRCFFVDKDFSQLEALSSVFSETEPCLCTFRVSSEIRKALSNKCLSSSQMKTICHHFAQMKEELTEEGYLSCRERLLSALPSSDTDYLFSDWFNKPKSWAAHQFFSPRMHVTVTNQCISYHQKLKKLLSLSKNFPCAIQILLNYDSTIAHSRSHEQIRRSNTMPVSFREVAVTYLKDFTTFAASLINDQYLLFTKREYYILECGDGPGSTYSVMDRAFSLSYSTSVSSCSCPFFKGFSLPCCHIFFMRLHFSLPLYSPVSADHRFRRPSFVTRPSGTSHSAGKSVSPKIDTPVTRSLRTSSLFKKMSSYLSLVGDEIFEEKFSFLSSLYEAWSSSSGVTSDVHSACSVSSNVTSACSVSSASARSASSDVTSTSTVLSRVRSVSFVSPHVTHSSTVSSRAMTCVTPNSSALSNATPASSGVTSPLSNVTPASSGVTAALSNVTPASSVVTSALSNVTPASSSVISSLSNVTPALSGVTSALTNVTPASSGVTSALSDDSSHVTFSSTASSNALPASSAVRDVLSSKSKHVVVGPMRDSPYFRRRKRKADSLISWP